MRCSHGWHRRRRGRWIWLPTIRRRPPAAANAGTVFVGQTADTPAFAVDCIEKWWRTEGRKRYPEAKTLQILADGGGSNSCTARAWKFNLQHRLCNRHGLRVRVAHYPPATSKWNPIEHRLFCEISKNWAGRPLDSFETILKYLRTTRTSTGLRVRAYPGLCVKVGLATRRKGLPCGTNVVLPNV